MGSLFSGIGAIEIGFEKAGFRTEWFIECDEYAKSVLQKRFPGVTIYSDIKKVNFGEVTKVTILTGGFPCQDISKSGKGDGIEGHRSSLWSYYKEAIRKIRPKYAFIENVPTLSSRGLNIVLADLAEIGYDAEWMCISASTIGANHRRERLFIIAYPYDFRCLDRTDEGSMVRQGRQAFNEIIPCFGWQTQPPICRVDDGTPNRVDRLKCLGNSVLPQIVELFALAIKEFDDKKKKEE